MKFCQKAPLLKRGKNFSVIKENLPLIHSPYFQNMTNMVRDFFWGKSAINSFSLFSEHDKYGQRFSVGKLSEILAKSSTTEEETNFSLIRENYPSINSRYFEKVT
ncbi:MAG: hypothetical protein F6K23_02850 [Okeania sp. SIO2C9]|uniref:hypothetical protein n=1 Tax=Okeania sp. SIO2C9 TaxID=2607791 RepID=UPI0013C0F3EE|nr:hypothetical protein [Okeania sp. SIO2C9]NEQ72107.1 hypothetical protein [Okeania sp. SIO2C9]